MELSKSSGLPEGYVRKWFETQRHKEKFQDSTNCDDCGKSFFDKSNLKRHINAIQKGVKGEKLKCDEQKKVASGNDFKKTKMNLVQAHMQDWSCKILQRCPTSIHQAWFGVAQAFQTSP